MLTSGIIRASLSRSRHSFALSFTTKAGTLLHSNGKCIREDVRLSPSEFFCSAPYSTLYHNGHSRNWPQFKVRFTNSSQMIRTVFSSSSFSALPPEEEEAEKNRVASLTPYQKEMELRQLDSELARLQTLRAINTGELYTLRGKFKMLSRDYGMGFLAWYWTVWFATAGLSYAAIELGGVDPIVVMSKAEMWLGWESGTISGRVDPTLGQLGLVIVLNECLEPLRLPIVVVTTKPVVNAFTKNI